MKRAALVPFALLMTYGLAFAAAALGGSLFLFDDHPGQYFRLWHALSRGLAPWTWNPDWWMGFPELQFYPPGFTYLGAALHAVTLGWLPPAGVYQAALWIVYLAPGATAFALLARLAGNGWLALPGAFLALTLSAGTASGVDGGVRTGMIAARLGWALLPLVVLALVRWTDRGGARPALAAPALAAVVLAHPAHAPAAALYVLLAAAAGAGYKPYRLFQAGWLALTAALFTAFWTVPLLARLAGARALAWGDPAWETLGRAVAGGPLLPLLLLALAVAAPALARDRVTAVLAGFVPAMLLVIALDPTSWLPANRLVDSLLLGVVLAAGAGLARLLDLASRRLRLPPPAAGLLAVAALAALSLPDPRALTLWPDRAGWPRRAAIERELKLPELWQAVRAAPPGRVLFVRSGLPLVPGTAWYRAHTHVTALAPLYAGREIVNGTFTHPSPIAALVYTGSPAPGPIRSLVERLDGVSLFGRPLAAIDPVTLERFLDFLGVSTVVALGEDVARFPALAGDPRFTRTSLPPYAIFASRTPVRLPEQVNPDRWRILLDGDGRRWVSARVAFSPLWRAETGGETLPARRGAFGDLEVLVPGPRTTVDLVYREGQWERAGIVLTALGALLWAGHWLSPRRRRGR